MCAKKVNEKYKDSMYRRATIFLGDLKYYFGHPDLITRENLVRQGKRIANELFGEASKEGEVMYVDTDGAFVVKEIKKE